jgi:hypothetical protein
MFSVLLTEDWLKSNADKLVIFTTSIEDILYPHDFDVFSIRYSSESSTFNLQCNKTTNTQYKDYKSLYDIICSKNVCEVTLEQTKLFELKKKIDASNVIRSSIASEEYNHCVNADMLYEEGSYSCSICYYEPDYDYTCALCCAFINSPTFYGLNGVVGHIDKNIQKTMLMKPIVYFSCAVCADKLTSKEKRKLIFKNDYLLYINKITEMYTYQSNLSTND